MSKQISLFDIENNELFNDLKPHIVKKFWKFHQENPHVFDLFKKYTHEMSTRRQRYGINSITERIRWHVAFETNDENFKLNNNHAPCYARLLILDNPSLKNFFQLKKTRLTCET